MHHQILDKLSQQAFALAQIRQRLLTTNGSALAQVTGMQLENMIIAAADTLITVRTSMAEFVASIHTDGVPSP